MDVLIPEALRASLLVSWMLIEGVTDSSLFPLRPLFSTRLIRVLGAGDDSLGSSIAAQGHYCSAIGATLLVVILMAATTTLDEP